MQIFDTHCHIHSSNFEFDPGVLTRASEAGVSMICVGTDAADSEAAIKFVAGKDNCHASIGLHPHDAKLGEGELKKLEDIIDRHNVSHLDAEQERTEARSEAVQIVQRASTASSAEAMRQEPSAQQAVPVDRKAMRKIVVAVGECGLDYFYNHSNKKDQEKALRFQIELALKNDLPLIFHVRDAFDNFWPIFDSYKNVKGVLHSFTDSETNMHKAIERGLYIGVNGIITFTKASQLKMYKNIPLSNLLLETDSPFLTPVPYRGKPNEPANVVLVAHFLAQLKGEKVETIFDASTQNAKTLFRV